MLLCCRPALTLKNPQEVEAFDGFLVCDNEAFPGRDALLGENTATTSLTHRNSLFIEFELSHRVH